MNRIVQSNEERYNYNRIFTKTGPPQGMNEEQFQELSVRIRSLFKEVEERTGQLGDDIFVHGSRASQTAAPDSDLDIGIRVSEVRFAELIELRFERVTVGSDRWDTLQTARERGRLHSGEAGVSGVRREMIRLIKDVMILGFATVQISVIREGGMFDRGPFVPLWSSRGEGSA